MDKLQPYYHAEPLADGERAVEWSCRKIDGIWCVGMEGNLDTVHDATLKITGGFLSDEGARQVAEQVVEQHNAALSRPDARVERRGPATIGTIIASGYPLTDSERQSLARQIDARFAPLVEALGWFVDDQRFHVSVGGNPFVVQKMIKDAVGIYLAAIAKAKEQQP